MPVFNKLMEARMRLHKMELKKSGENKFAGYRYFELGDFLPQTMQIFHDLKMASVVSFTEELATLTILDLEDSSQIAITSPMAQANLKGAHPIQNLGAVESYQRRYLWLAAMEIVENDVIDASPGAAPPPPEPPKKRPQAVIEGQPGAWQLKVTLAPDGDVREWLKVIEDACKIALDSTSSEDDVMQIFKKNKQLFDTVKTHDPMFFKGLMSKFTQAKTRFTEQS
jgi:ERF superfamily